MKSMLCLGNVSPPPRLVRTCSKSMSSLWGTGLHFSLSNASSSLTTNYTCSPLGHFVHPITCSSSRPSGSDNRDENKTVRGAVGASLVLACALGIVSIGLRMCPKAIAGPRELSQKAPRSEAFPLGGTAALKSLLDVTVQLTSGKLRRPEKNFRLPSRPSIQDVNNTIKMRAVRLMKYHEPEDAVHFLEGAYDKYKYDPEPAYHVEMALVEILLCQGEYNKALERHCLREHQASPSDARIPLYKAIIYTMLEDTEEARKWWEEYMEAIDDGFNLPKS